MRFVEQVNALLWAWLEMLRAFRRRAALAPLLVYAAAQTAILLAVVFFAYPPLSAVVAPALKWRFGAQALHYPNNFFALRGALGQMDLPLSVLLGPLSLGAAAVAFAAFYAGRRERLGAAFRWAGVSYPPLLCVTALATLLAQAASQLPLALWGHLAEDGPARFRLVRFATIAVVLAIQALLVYAIPSISAGRTRLGPALAGSIRLALRQPVTTYLIVAVPAAFELLPAWLVRKSAVIAVRLSPEFLAVVMLVWVALIFLANYAIVGAATRLYAHSTEDVVHGIAAGKEA